MTEKLFAAGGELGELALQKDWSTTPLGPVSGWSQALRTTVGMLLRSRFPMLLWWGPEFTQIYNDAYSPVLGEKHPHRALGKPVTECWEEVWPVIGPMIEAPFRTGVATATDDLDLIVRRKGFAEEAHFNVSYSPVPDESVPSGIGGVLATVAETTAEVYGRRQLATLGALARQAAEAKTAEAACETAVRTLEDNARDVPCAICYLRAADGSVRRVSARPAGRADEIAFAPPSIAADADDAWPVTRVLRERCALEVALAGGAVPRGAWDRPPTRGLLLPLSTPEQAQAYGVLFVALNPHRALDDGYRTFLTLAADHVTSAVRNARAYEHERERAEKLAAIDRAKTAFFSNVSHEFRTPLTLMLGPLQDAVLAGRSVGGVDLETVHRNALRLLKLVNSLLDFARIEAGRVTASFVPTDLARETRDLASAFASAFERAGVRLDLSGVEGLGEPAYVDHDMWEKIVLNLLSNALKFTFEGSVALSLRVDGPDVELAVADTGIGIAAEEMPRLFERFHRIRGARARTHEGSGIGLALVQELARLHGGSARAESEPGKGTTFFVRIKRGRDHVPNDQVETRPALASTAVGAAPFVEEAARWLPSGDAAAPQLAARPAAGPRARVLVADDNADMRDYLARLLSARYDVVAVSNGAEALAEARGVAPDLVVADVMMPILDGLELVRAFKEDPRLQAVPVVLLSARAGDEATADGLSTGADDYVVKPFSARELLARVEGQVARGRLRSDLASARHEAEAASRAKDEFIAMLGHELRNPLAPIVTAVDLLELRGVAARERAIIDRQVRHLTRLVDDLLDVSRIARGKIRLETEVLDVAAFLADAIETATPVLEQSAHRLRVAAPKGRLFVEGDRGRLAQVIANLLVNAAKYTDPGGAIDVRAAEEEGQVVIEVSDTGRGMGPDLLPRVFELFEQGARAIDRAQGGLGVGLAIVKNLVRLHGGTVAASSDGPGRGSVFTVRLPAAKAPADAAAPVTAREGSPGRDQGVRVLIVDDNEDGAEMLDEVLRSMGYSTRIAYDGVTAIEVASRFEPDVALIDIGLPVMDGYAVARRLRAMFDGRAVLVAVTGYGQESDRARARAAGFDRHLVKPVEMALLADVLTARA